MATVLVSRPYLLADDAPVDPPAGWSLIPRPLWALAAVAFLSLFIEGAIGDWGTVYLDSILHVSAATAATGYAAFSLSMMMGCFVGDYLNIRFGAASYYEFRELWWPLALDPLSLVRRTPERSSAC